MIKKTNKGYQVTSKNSGKNLGKFATRLEAIRRLQQVEYFKRKGHGKA